MVSTKVFWARVGAYNETMWPIAIAMIAAAAFLTYRVFLRPGSRTDALLPWALMGLPKCFGALDCYEDCILFASGVYGLVELIRNWKTRQAEAQEEPLVQHKVTG